MSEHASPELLDAQAKAPTVGLGQSKDDNVRNATDHPEEPVSVPVDTKGKGKVRPRLPIPLLRRINLTPNAQAFKVVSKVRSTAHPSNWSLSLAFSRRKVRRRSGESRNILTRYVGLPTSDDTSLSP